MSAHMYKKIEIVGSSPTSIEEAVNNAVAKASDLKNNLISLKKFITRLIIT